MALRGGPKDYSYHSNDLLPRRAIAQRKIFYQALARPIVISSYTLGQYILIKWKRFVSYIFRGGRALKSN